MRATRGYGLRVGPSFSRCLTLYKTFIHGATPFDQMPSTRRTVLVAVAAGLAGCTATPDTTNEARPDDHPTDSDGSTPPDDDCTSGFHVALKAFAPSDDLRVHAESATEQELVTAAVETGETTRSTYGDATLGEGVVAHDDAYYWLSVTDAGAETVTAYLFDISWENGRTAPDDATVFAFDDLPESDREAVRFLVPDGSGEEGHGHPTESLSGRDRPVPYPEGGDDSALLPRDTVWVRYDDREYRLSTGRETTLDRRRYRYTAERIAGSRDELRAWADDRFLVDLSLTDAQRDLLEAARGDYYEECSPASEALAGLRDQLGESAGLPGPTEGWYVAFDGDRYRLEILQWVE